LTKPNCFGLIESDVILSVYVLAGDPIEISWLMLFHFIIIRRVNCVQESVAVSLQRLGLSMGAILIPA
jgi:hypothetical protein